MTRFRTARAAVAALVVSLVGGAVFVTTMATPSLRWTEGNTQPAELDRSRVAFVAGANQTHTNDLVAIPAAATDAGR